MIDEIFKIIMTEARARPGKDLASKIQNVLLDVDVKVIEAIENIRETERRKKINER